MNKWHKFQNSCDSLSRFCLIATGLSIPLSVTGIAIFLNLTVLFSLLAGSLKEKFLALRHNQVVFIALFIFLLLLLSVLYSTAPSVNILQALVKYSKLLYIVFLMPLFIEKKWQEAGINAFLAAMFITVLAGFLKKIGWVQIGPPGQFDTLFTNHINAGLLIAFAVFILAHRCFTASSKMRWLYFIWFLLTAYFLFFINEGRTGYLVFIALFLLFLYQKSHWKGLLSAVVLAPLLLIGLFFVSPNFQQRAEWIKQDIENYYQHRLKDNSVGLRMVFIGNSLRLVSYHPIVGTGVGSFQTEYAQHFAPAPGFENMRHPQIDYLLIAVQLGMLGLLVFLALFYSEWRASFLLDKKNRDLAQGFILAFMVGTTCDSLLYLAIPGYFFIYFTSLFFAPRTLKLGKNALPRHYQDPRYPLKLKPQQKIAFVMSPRLGDALISMVTVHNLQRNHFQVTVWSDHLYDLRAWFPGVEIQRRPQAEQTHAIFSAFDVVLHAFFVDVIGNMQNWHPGVFILEYSTYNWLNINMIDIQVQFCQYLLGLQNVVRENGMRAPAALQYRQSLQRIIIHPTSSSATKNWLSQRFVALAQRLKQQQWQPELVVSNAERPAWLWVETQNLALPVFKNIDGVARYLYQSGWFIGNDSGLGHLASALGIPTLTLCMRPKVAKKWRPGWAVGLVLLPPKWLITRPLKEKFWKYFITVKQVLKNFVRLQTMSMQEK